MPRQSSSPPFRVVTVRVASEVPPESLFRPSYSGTIRENYYGDTHLKEGCDCLVVDDVHVTSELMDREHLSVGDAVECQAYLKRWYYSRGGTLNGIWVALWVRKKA